jgi:hypothetical protein
MIFWILRPLKSLYINNTAFSTYSLLRAAWARDLFKDELHISVSLEFGVWDMHWSHWTFLHLTKGVFAHFGKVNLFFLVVAVDFVLSLAE